MYLFIAALLILAAKSQLCTSNDNCNGTSPICYETGVFSLCVQCLDTTDCTSNSNYGPGYECLTGNGTGYGFCFLNPIGCVNDTDCTAFGEGYACQINPIVGTICSNETSPYCSTDYDCDMDQGFTCQYNPIYGISYCSNETSPYCSSDADCVGLYGTLTASCQNYTTYLNVSGSVTDVVVPYCLPVDQCVNDTDCGIGSTCGINPELGFRYCAPDNTTCSQDADCGDGLACYVPESECYLPCSNDTDCIVDGWNCVSPEVGIWACLPFGFNATTTMTPITTEGGSTTEEGSTTEQGSTTEYGTTTTESPCSTNDNCTFALEPVCDTDTYECVTCLTDTDCEDNMYYGAGTVCGELWGSPSCVPGPCENDDGCGSMYYPVCGNDGNCTACNDNTDCEDNDMYGEGYVCATDQGWIPNYCYSNDTSGPSTTDGDSDSTIECTEDSECENTGEDGGKCTEVTIATETMKFCIPDGISLCSEDSECLTGATCITQGQGISYCYMEEVNGCTVDGDDCATGLTCYDASSYDNEDNFCYLACTVDTQADDCDADGYICATQTASDVIEYLTCIYDPATTTTTTSAAPSNDTTTTNEDGEGPNPSGVEELAIFGGMIIMISNALFM